MALDAHHQDDEQRYHHRRDPRAFDKFGNKNDENGDAGGEGAQPVDEHMQARAFVLLAPPVHDHASLREREGEEGADGIERDEAVRDAAEDDEQNGSEGGERVDAVGVEQTAAANDEDAGKEFVEGDGAGEAWEVGEGGIGGERKNQQDGADGDVVEDAAPHDCRGQFGEHALVVR